MAATPIIIKSSLTVDVTYLYQGCETNTTEVLHFITLNRSSTCHQRLPVMLNKNSADDLHFHLIFTKAIHF